ncbi:hypothetical protein [Bacillus amyloliquefaciens]|uniref:hypothetical protein n=1 Tax=Bacillus amyloliquefaciens TaxID=1390 RepID=UPI002FFC6E92
MVIDRAVNIKKDQFWFYVNFSFFPFISRVFFNIIIQKVFLPENRLDEIPFLPTKTNSFFPHTTAIKGFKGGIRCCADYGRNSEDSGAECSGKKSSRRRDLSFFESPFFARDFPYNPFSNIIE